MYDTPTPGQIYRHRKHSPAADHWHEYRVVGIVEPHSTQLPISAPATHWYYPNQYHHTGTEKLHTLIGCGTKIYANVSKPHIAYKNTRPDLCDPEWVFCLMPLSEFWDGRFELVEPASAPSVE